MTREKIYDVSEKHFFAKRYSDVKLDNIAGALDIRKPSLYYYFTDKKDLFAQTLKYSMDKYIKSLKDIVDKNDLKKFVEWYLVYPSENKNLFAIALQKGYCIDSEINNIIFSGKTSVSNIVNTFLKSFDVSEVRSFLIINMLDKLAEDNCVDGYCLKFKIEDIYTDIKKLLEVK